MSTDVEIMNALRAAVGQAGQPDTLADKLCAWCEEVVSGNEDLADADAVQRRLDVIFGALSVDIEHLDNGSDPP